MSETLTRAEREELAALSKEVYGSSSRYQKLMKQGVAELVTEELDEIVPGEKEGDPDITRKVKIPVKYENGALKYTVKYHTKESVKELMLERKAQIDLLKAEIKKRQDEEKAKKLAEQIQIEASGSAKLE